MKKILSLICILSLLCTMLVACKDDLDIPTEDTTKHIAPAFADLDLNDVLNIDAVTVSETETDYVLLDVANYGKILIRLYPDVAPETVANFKKLVSQGFYDGLIFHRVIEGFMIQGGDPLGNGTGGSETNIKGEFQANGFKNNLQHLRGVVSMARATDMNSASSQFFICHAEASHLNGNYAAFGYVAAGMDVVDAIASVQTNSSDKPTTNVVISSAKFANVPAEAMTKPAEDTPTRVAPAFADLDLSDVSSIDAVTVSETETDYVLLDVADYGKILIRLYPDVAPETVANFKKLVSQGFYDGLIFHRVVEDFVIQSGDPNGTGTGGSPDKIKGEFSKNGFENNLKHVRGVVSMARTINNMNSASSQFFICHQSCSSLNGYYAAFGYVAAGMDVVDAIAAVDTDTTNDKPIVDVVITSAKFVVVPADNGTAQ